MSAPSMKLPLRCCVLVSLALLAAAARKSLHKAAEQGDLGPLRVAISGRRDEYND